MSQSLRAMLAEQKQLLAYFEEQFDKMEDDEATLIELNLSEILGAIPGKIDAIKGVIDALETNAATLRERWLRPIQKKCMAMEAEAQRVRTYVKTEMTANGHTKLPGSAFRAALQKSSPSVVFDVECTEEHFRLYPEIVTRKISYEWNKSATKEKLDSGFKLSFATLKSSTSLRFYPVNQSAPRLEGE